MSHSGTPRDTSRARWTRTRRKLDRYITELREHGVDVTVPDGWEKPAAERFATGGIIKSGILYLVGENGPERLVPPKDRQL